MKYSKLESLERKKAALARELAAIDQTLGVISDEAAAAKEQLAKKNAALCGSVLYRLMKKRHEADPTLAAAELQELSKVLVNGKSARHSGCRRCRSAASNTAPGRRTDRWVRAAYWWRRRPSQHGHPIEPLWHASTDRAAPRGSTR